MAVAEPGRPRSGRGGKLNRSEVVTIRMDPKLRFIVELVARKERRTVSSLIEWCIETALDHQLEMRDPREQHPMGGKNVSALLAGILVWDVEESDRFVKQACAYPETLNVDEQRIWKVIMEADCFHRDTAPSRAGNFNLQLIRRHWDDIKKTASGEMSIAHLLELGTRSD